MLCCAIKATCGCGDCARAWAGQASGSDVDAAGRELKDQNVISGSLGGEHALLSTFVCFFFVCLFLQRILKLVSSSVPYNILLY